MATGNTNFGNSAGTGTIGADQFNGPLVGNVTGSVTGGTTLVTATVAAAGATQGTATAIPGTAFLVNVTATTSSEGVKLPTAATGKNITTLAPNTKGFKIYGGAAGQLINANTTATTAFAVTTAAAVTFYGIDATHWRTSPEGGGGEAGSFSTLAASGLTTLSGGLTLTGPQKDVLTTVAAAGATQGTATAIVAAALLVRVNTTTSSEGVKLPTAVTGKVLTLLPPPTIGVKAYGAAAGQLINANTTATTAFALASAQPVTFYAVDATHWRVVAPGAFTATTLSVSGAGTVSGLLSATGGFTTGGVQKEVLTTVAAAGATQGTATAISATACLVNVTVTASTEGVRLPTASTGRAVTLLTPTTKGYKVYGGAAGQLINAFTTNTTAFAMTTNHPATFIGVDATHWRVVRGN